MSEATSVVSLSAQCLVGGRALLSCALVCAWTLTLTCIYVCVCVCVHGLTPVYTLDVMTRAEAFRHMRE